MAEKDVHVSVILKAPGSNPPFKFESSDVPIDANNVIYFSNCGKFKGFMVHYDLVDTANPGFIFPTQIDDALWVTDSGPCPTQACKWEQFEAKRVENGGHTLVVKNKNRTVQDFAYTLRVKNGTNWLDLDPGGSNQNGGLPLYESSAVGIVTGAVVGLGAAALATNALEPIGAVVFALGGAVVGLIVGFVLDRL